MEMEENQSKFPKSFPLQNKNNHFVFFSEKYWIRIPRFCPGLVEQVYNEIKDYLKKMGSRMNVSLLLKEEKIDRRELAWVSDYSNIPNVSIENFPTVLEIKNKAERIFGFNYDFCLVQFYPDGNSTIGWHNDKENIVHPITSISLGASRKFRFRKMKKTSGWSKEMILRDGDCVIMRGRERKQKSCQEIYKHSIPREAKIKESRINITFRILD